MSIEETEAQKKMRTLIKNKNRKGIGEDSIVSLDDGTELKAIYEEDK